MLSIFLCGQILNYSLIVLPILIMKQIKNTLGIGISKTLYLSPIDLNDRKAYVKTLIFINIVFSFVLYLIIGIIFLAKGIFMAKFYILNFVTGMLFIICDNLDITNYKYKYGELEWYDEMMLFSKAMTVCCFFTSLLLDSEVMRICVAICIVFLVIQICLTIGILSYREKIIKILIDYEETFVIKHK
ncbi:MAG: hypothetical protein ACI3VR_03840 [Intestinibacter sp.]|uniref:hypothetical protein n=1 Tax=Intestinibacter sp. TaxID=1965304 RepID=UPI003F18413D